MNQQSPQQQPASQSQGSQPTPPLPQSQPKKPRRLSTQVKVALIGASGVILAAIISGIFTLHPFPLLHPTPTPSSSPTSPPSPNVYPPSDWKMVFEDPMNADNGYWSTGTLSIGGSCSFNGDVLHISAQNNAIDCFLTQYDVTNFTFEVQMTLIKGDLGAIDFRWDYTAQSGYSFWFRQNGAYGLEIWRNNTVSKVLSTGNSSAIHIGYNQPNLIAVVAQGNTFSLFANKQLLTNVTDNDSTYGFGKIGLDASARNNDPTEVISSNAKLWEPSS